MLLSGNEVRQYNAFAADSRIAELGRISVEHGISAMFLDYLNNPYYAGKGIRNENVYDTQKFLPYENVCDKLPFRVASLGSWYRYLKRLWPNIYEVYNISYVPPQRTKNLKPSSNNSSIEYRESLWDSKNRTAVNMQSNDLAIMIFPPEFYREALNNKFGFYKSDCKKMYLCALQARPSSTKFSDSPIERRMDTLEEIFFLVLKERVNIWIALNNEKKSHEFTASANL